MVQPKALGWTSRTGIDESAAGEFEIQNSPRLDGALHSTIQYTELHRTLHTLNRVSCPRAMGTTNASYRLGQVFSVRIIPCVRRNGSRVCGHGRLPLFRVEMVEVERCVDRLVQEALLEHPVGCVLLTAIDVNEETSIPAAEPAVATVDPQLVHIAEKSCWQLADNPGVSLRDRFRVCSGELGIHLGLD